jgi:hypothetical protein
MHHLFVFFQLSHHFFLHQTSHSHAPTIYIIYSLFCVFNKLHSY